jgi:hypothetical protein
MKTHRNRARMRGTSFCCAILSTILIVLFCADCAFAQETPTIVRVEEDWELVVATPDANSTAPQVTCAIYPFSGSSLFATLELNHQSQPDFVPGGMQLVVWNDEFPIDTRKFPQTSTMSTSSETVRWTQVMSLEGGNLVFEVVNGSSQTWDAFGGQGYLRSTVSTELSNLNTYTPTASVGDSGVGYAANRVTLLRLKTVRLVTSEGEVLEDTTERQVYPRD